MLACVPTRLLPALVALAAACTGSSLDEPAVPRAALCAREESPPGCLQPADVEHWLRRSDLEIVGQTGTPKGKQRARVLTLAVPEPGGRVVFRAKWRAHTTSHRLNRPRYELATYALQKLFLPPDAAVVPPTAGHCFPLHHYREHVDPRAEPPFDAIECVFGTLSYWLEDAMDLAEAEDRRLIESDQLLDETLFWSSSSYRRSLADVNLLAHLISHGDSHPAQFVISGGRARPRVHLVDNTIAFSGYKNPSIAPKWDWSRLQVPALSRESVARLAVLSKADVRRLAVVEQYAIVEGQLVPTRPLPPRATPNSGLRWRSADLQIGLTHAEIERLWERTRALLSAVESGRIRTF
jgi:hypothetical protein